MPGGVLFAIRELLFQIAEHSPTLPATGETLWFYHAVKQETASSIYYGFSTLFPSLLDRIQVMNRLLGDTPSVDQSGCSPTKKLLVPMLIPCFTSAKMLFQLMSESDALFALPASTATAVIVRFMDTLLETLWRQTLDQLGNLDECIREKTEIVKSLEALEASNEFKCLNVFVRAAIYWCAQYTHAGWFILESTCAKLVSFTTTLMQRGASLPSSRAVALPCIIQHTFPGKLLPFALLSALSLPAIRELLPTLLDAFWSKLEELALSTHDMLKALKSCHDVEQAPATTLATSDRSDCATFDLAQTVHMTLELRKCLALPSGAISATYRDVLQRIWAKAVASPSVKSCKVKDNHDGSELHRISIPSDLTALFGSETLLVECTTSVAEAAALRTVTFESGAISFAPSRMILSQQIYPLTPSEPIGMPMGVSIPSHTLVERNTSGARSLEFSDAMLAESYAWLQDLQKILVWAGSHYAATLITGAEAQADAAVDPRWAASPLFHGGLMGEQRDANISTGRDEVLLQQIVDNVGPGKKLVEKVRHALDPSAGGGNGTTNLHLKATRLKRQDSVDAAIEKSGGYEIVDRAVRGAFAALLKHSNVFYIAEPLSKDGVPSEAIVDAWRSALQLRRWYVSRCLSVMWLNVTWLTLVVYVRQQDRARAAEASGALQVRSHTSSTCNGMSVDAFDSLSRHCHCSERAGTDNFTPEALAKERQQALYSAVCEPIISRALLLLQLSPAPIATPSVCSSPIKLLPGISSAPRYGTL